MLKGVGIESEYSGSNVREWNRLEWCLDMI